MQGCVAHRSFSQFGPLNAREKKWEMYQTLQTQCCSFQQVLTTQQVAQALARHGPESSLRKTPNLPKYDGFDPWTHFGAAFYEVFGLSTFFGSAGGAKNVAKYCVWRPWEAFVEPLPISQRLRFSMFFDHFGVLGVSDKVRKSFFWSQQKIKKHCKM